ncbi:uncharacterized protein LOC128676687 [Plodia interpunctella]|uniref:uncharacterized protein LOC128676687 n=1 Tax=Plodia interpunctella TaxID=58824 RepID=UPI002367DA62|nr:uncharacterized protein LOC128676687 [Plodia interpunctella]
MAPSFFAMLLFIVLLHLFGVLGAYSVKCINESYYGTTFKPSVDGVKGRYDVEWCTIGSVNATQWDLILSYNLARKQKNCNNRTHPAQKHSEFTYHFAPEDVNCTHMCFYTTLDNVFSGCFILENWLPARGTQRSFHGQYITNDYTIKSFTDNIIKADAFTHEKYVAVHWHLGNVVAVDFEMTLCSVNRTTSQIHEKEKDCTQVNDNCTVLENNPHEIVCKLSDLNGAYFMALTLFAPWTVAGNLKNNQYSHYSFEVADAATAGIRTGGWRAGAAATALALALCGAGAGAAWLCARRARAARRLQRAVLHSWRQRKPGADGETEPEPQPEPGAALLLYAREPAPGAALARALADLLSSAGLQVFDLYSPEVVSMSAAAPADWLRSMLERDDVSVVLLQTPALAAMYGDRSVPLQTGCGAQTALLRARAAPAEPAPGDALLALALRLLAEDVHTPAPYNKYFLAQLESLETDALPHTVPFRRYAVPRAAPRLLLDLLRPQRPQCPQRPECPQQPQLRALERAAHGFLRRVAADPGYLKDHLLILD